MKKYLAAATVFAFFCATFAELYSPDVWFSFRRDTLSFSAGVSDDNTEKTIQYELQHRDQNGKLSVLATRSVRANDKEWNLEFAGIRRETVGRHGLWVREIIDGKSNVYGPYGLVRTPLLETTDSAGVFSGDLKNFALSPDEFYKFAYNKNGLIIALNTNKGNITVSLDLANSKTAFLAFANRIIRFSAEDGSVEFLYPERSIERRTTAIEYRVRDWEGDMKVQDLPAAKILFIPWYDLGMLFEEGRRFGFMVHGDNVTYPVKASHHVPATWGNIILQ